MSGFGCHVEGSLGHWTCLVGGEPPGGSGRPLPQRHPGAARPGGWVRAQLCCPRCTEWGPGPCSSVQNVAAADAEWGTLTGLQRTSGGAWVHPWGACGASTFASLHPQGAINCLFPVVTTHHCQTGIGDPPPFWRCPDRTESTDTHPCCCEQQISSTAGSAESLLQSPPHIHLGGLHPGGRGCASQSESRSEAASSSSRVSQTGRGREDLHLCGFCYLFIYFLPLSFLTVKS